MKRIKFELAERLCKIMGWEGKEWYIWGRNLTTEDLKELVEKLEFLDPRNKKIPHMSTLPFSVRAFNALIDAGINETEKLLTKEPKDLLLLKAFGSKSLSEVRKVLKGYGLYLKGDQLW